MLLRGFAEPVGQAQACFRGVLDAMAHPGRIVTLDAPAPPPPLCPATAAVLLTLLDADTSIWLDPACAAAADWLTFHCGSPFVEPPRAGFAVACEMPQLSDLHDGTDEAPETATTLVLQVADLGHGTVLRLFGPGLRNPATLAVRGLPDDFSAQWRTNHKSFPRGIDLILCAGSRIAALPRSVEIS
jgi:alpha-D-ribose 1-methylphosphonate 5-triphosphate synthase subunit PhnH